MLLGLSHSLYKHAEQYFNVRLRVFDFIQIDLILNLRLFRSILSIASTKVK